MEEKKGVDIDIDAANIVKESLGGLATIIPILDRHPRGSLAALILVGILCTTAIAIMHLSRQVIIEKPPATPQGVFKNRDLGAGKSIGSLDLRESQDP